MSHPHVVQFVDAVRPWAEAYRNSTLSFVALAHENEFVIVAAALRLNANAGRPLKAAFETTSLRAAEVPINGSTDAVLQFTRAALSGQPLVVGDYVLKFLKDPSSGYTAYHDHASSEYRAWDGSYVDRLRLSGARQADFLNNRVMALESELQPKGYRSLNELMRKFDFELSASDMLSIDIVAEPIARITTDSKLRGRTAQLSVQLAAALSPDRFLLTVLDADAAGTSFRLVISGSELEWTRSETNWVGVCTIEIPKIAIVTCRAVYSGLPHDEVQIWDPETLPNLRRTLVELADPGLQHLRSPLIAPKSNKEQNDFEASVAVLFYMLGFDSVRVGGVKKLSEAVDIFASTDTGQVLIVECTTAVLDPKDKLGKLIDRVTQARERLSRVLPGFDPNRVTGMIVIPKMRAELSPDWKVAERRGIIVLCRPDIEAALDRTRFAPDAELVLRKWRQGPLTELLSHGLSGVDHQV